MQIQRILFASAEYSNKSMGLMNGALLSGQMAATLAKSRLPDLEGSGEGSSEINNELPTIARLSDDASERTLVNLLPVVPHSSAFEYRTSTHYPPTNPIETSTFTHFSFGNTVGEDGSGTTEDLGNTLLNDAEVESSAPNSSFLYQTSTQYPPSSTMDMSTITHFSFGNAEPPRPFIPPEIVPNPNITTIPPPTTTERTTFTPVNPSRITTPFSYHTSTLYSPLQALETTTYKHFSYGDKTGAEPGTTKQQDTIARNPVDAEIVRNLKDTADELKPGKLTEECNLEVKMIK
ncbi:hypothetical protein OESDEN_03351 [Oesophagostomum dentatum]|uniref:Uncharacterized protein n=1 Tax=Oesophagostomum dentatum TaxID=61180 RepID=A0A0B1THH8_OESDE|nr:hypothetical protein OESDEN_03351 [Oesophagostomum dentatum]